MRCNFSKNSLRYSKYVILTFLAVNSYAVQISNGQDAKADKTTAPEQSLIGQFEKSPELEIQLVADSSKISHPIAFSVDDYGRVFVAESFRYIDQRGGWTDIRWRMPWLQSDLASRTIEDRKNLYESRLGEELPEWKVASERIRLLESPDERGVFQKSSVFADGFNDLLDGTIAGVLATRNHVYVTNIPSLWRLDGAERSISTARKALHTGFGARLGYLGHDLHGLCWGPDGRLYFSLGDRGANIKTEDGRTIAIPDTGGVFRCEADGSNLELYAKGLRNPQELAFDALGNLWTCDNNADRGDKARWVWILPGGDSGWRIGYQHLNVPVALGAWTSEKIWYPSHPDQSGHIVPPVANLAQGPSGVAAHPGTGLSSSYTGQFLVCDYLGDGGGIYAVDVKRSGAGYEMRPERRFLWRTPANDVDFAPDGSVLFTTWTGGIAPESSGALYRVKSSDIAMDPLAKSTFEILKSNPEKATDRLLGVWLEHPDMRVRRLAQTELVQRGPSSIQIFVDCMNRSKNPLSKITSLWGIAQLNRLKNVSFPSDWKQWSHDENAEVRATLARVLADSSLEESSEVLTLLLDDTDQRVLLWAALGLKQNASKLAVAKLVEITAKHDDRDPWLRHALSSAMSACASAKDLVAFQGHESKAVRRIALIGLTQIQSQLLTAYLNDNAPLIVADSARAIHALRDSVASQKLAEFHVEKTREAQWSEINRNALVRRWIYANLREGSSSSASRLLALIQNNDFHENLRTEAILALNQWKYPPQLDSIEGLYFPVQDTGRNTNAAEEVATRKAFAFISSAQPPTVIAAVLEFMQHHPKPDYSEILQKIVQDSNYPATLRAKSLGLSVHAGFSFAPAELQKAFKSDEPEMRLVAISSVALLPEADRKAMIQTIFEHGTLPERQKAVSILYEIADSDSLMKLSQLVDLYVSEKLEPGLRLDVNLAVHKLAKEGRFLRQKIDMFMNSQIKKEPVGKWIDTLDGGNPERGKALFENRTELSCVRCHQSATAEQRVGPSLDKAGSRLSRQQILVSIVKPNAELAKGFETVVLGLQDGTTITGLIQDEKEDLVVVRTSDGKDATVQKSTIEERANGVSLMPDGLADKLTLEELRDLISYIGSL